MIQPNSQTLASKIETISITATAAAQHVGTLITASLPTGYALPNVLSITILGQVAAGTDRGALLYGGATNQYGYVAAGVEKTIDVRGADWYIIRSGVADVPTILDVNLSRAT